MVVGSKLRGIRLARGMTQEEVGALAGVGGPHVGQIETGAFRRPEARTLKALADALGVRVRDFFEARTLGERLQLARAERGMSQADAIAAVGVSWNTFYRLERDLVRFPKAEIITKAAAALGVAASDLLGEASTLGEAVRFARLSAGMTAAELAAKASLGETVISAFESGRRFPSARALALVVRAARRTLPGRSWNRDGPRGEAPGRAARQGPLAARCRPRREDLVAGPLPARTRPGLAGRRRGREEGPGGPRVGRRSRRRPGGRLRKSRVGSLRPGCIPGSRRASGHVTGGSPRSSRPSVRRPRTGCR